MAADALTMVSSPLESAQISKASSALLKHINSSRKQKAVDAPKKSLFADEDAHPNSEELEEDIPIWLILTTKQHVVDKNRLKPAKIPVPHSLHNIANERIILITAEPQRAYKNLIVHQSFPSSLSSKISRIIDIRKLKAKYNHFEAKRQLATEHDIFLADERIIKFLPGIMGKVLYKNGAKRPIPVCLTGKEKHEKFPDGKRRPKDTPPLVGQPIDVAKEIEKALNSALIYLSPSVSTAIKVGYASWKAESLAENIHDLVPKVVDKLIPKKWNNVKSVHIKGPETAALPIYMTQELWVDEEDVRDEAYVEPSKEQRKSKRSKRPLLEDGKVSEHRPTSEQVTEGAKKLGKGKKKRKVEELSDELEKEITARKAKLKKQKAEAMAEIPVEL